jgi:hypothetical protein
MRDRLAIDFGLTGAELALKLQNRTPTFVNNHAWALVRLQVKSASPEFAGYR